jgi:hypothetical protein
VDMIQFTEPVNDQKLEPADEVGTEFIEAGPITFAVEYRFLCQRDAEGELTDEVNDHGLTIHVYEGSSGIRAPEHLRFDCFLIRPHYHYISWATQRQEHVWYDPAASGDMVEWSIERLRNRLVPMLIEAGATELASRIDLRDVDAALPKVAGWAEALRERAQRNWQGPVYLTGAGVYPHWRPADVPGQ